MNTQHLSEKMSTSGHHPMQKPVKTIIKLIGLFKQLSAPLLPDHAGGEVKLHNEQGDSQVVLVIEGTVDIYRNADNMLFATARAPAIFGMQGSPYRDSIYKFISRPDCVLETLPLSSVIRIINANSLLEELLICQSYFNDYHAYRTNMLINKTSYEIVRALLLELDKVPSEIKTKINVPTFILERSHLARSGIMKILSHLRQGEYIKIESGKLISILRKLPKSF